MNQQLAFSIQLNDEARLSDFCWASNPLLEKQLLSFMAGQELFLYLFGEAGAGKSHILQACCQDIGTSQSAIYLPLHSLKHWGPQILEDLEDQDLICIDELEAIAGEKDWEEALFHLYNRVRDKQQTKLLLAAQLPPATLAIQLPDLRSRLAWCMTVQMQELSDEDKILRLQQRAAKRGFQLSEQVGQFLLKRCSRNMHALFEVLNSLDKASLCAQRKITIPFVKEILGV